MLKFNLRTITAPLQPSFGPQELLVSQVFDTVATMAWYNAKNRRAISGSPEVEVAIFRR
jgi:hypothetical protein